MFRFSTWLLIALPISVFGGNLPTVLTQYPTVKIVKSPVQSVETISVAPTYTKSFSPGGAAVAVAGTSFLSSAPVVQKIESYSAGDSSNAEIRDLLRSLLTELRSSKSLTTYSVPERLVKSSYSPPSDSYGPPSDSYGPPSDSYSAPPRNTYRDSGAPSYPDSFRCSKPEKFVAIEERLPTAIFAAPAAAAVAQVQTSLQAPVVKEVLRTVYQPVYLPVQYAAPQAELVSVAQPVQNVVSAVPTSIKTGVSAVAYSQVHSSPAYAIQKQQLAVPVETTAVLENGGWQK